MKNMAKSTTKRKPPEVIPSDYLAVNSSENWLSNSIRGVTYDKEFLRIISFYVLHSPCRLSSYSSQSLLYLGWKDSVWSSNLFREEFLSLSSIPSNLFQSHEYKSHFLSLWNSSGLNMSFFDENREFAIFINGGEKNPMLNLFHRIRNAFAHGRFATKIVNNECYFYMEDVTEIKDLTGLFAVARICVKKQTLLAWIDLLEKKNPSANQKLKSLFL